MIINHNTSALRAYNFLTRNEKTSSSLLGKIASGLRINQAADDAAGLAISEKMRSQIRGLSQAEKNVQDGVSLIQTAEGGLQESHTILQRMRELSVQAASDSLTSNDRLEIQKEIEQCKDQLNSIARQTNFNGKVLLDGSAAVVAHSSSDLVKVNVNGAILSRDQFGDIKSAEGTYRLDIKTQAGTGQVQGSNILTSRNDTLAEDIKLSPLGGEYSGLNAIQARGLMEGDYRIATRETPFGGISYSFDDGTETTNPVNDLGISTVSTSANPNIMPYGEYDLDIADQVPFMAEYANFADPAVPDIITGVHPTGMHDIDVNMDITSGQASCDAQTVELWNELTGTSQAAVVTKSNYNINMNTHFEVLGTDNRELLSSNVDAVTYYRSASGSTVDMNLSYRSQAGEQITAHTSYVTAANAQITLSDHNDPLKTVDVAVGGMTVDQVATALENAINALDGGNYANTDFTAVDLGSGQMRIEIVNNSGKMIDIIDSASNAAAELGIITGAGGLIDGGTISGASRDLNAAHIFDLGSKNIVSIASDIDAGLAAYNIDIMAVDLGGGLRQLQFNNNGVPRHTLQIDNAAPPSLESELNIGGIFLNPNGGSAVSNRVYHDHIINANVGDRHSDQIVNQLNNALQTALAGDDLAANNAVNPFIDHNNGDGTHSIWVDNAGASASFYDIRINDNINTTAADLGLNTHVVQRDDTDHTGAAIDFNRSLGTISSGSNIEEAFTAIQTWGFTHTTTWSNAANTPAYDGTHHNGQINIANNELGPTRREVVFLDSSGKDQLFGAGGDLSLAAGANANTQIWKARDRVQVQTCYTGVRNDGVFYSLQIRNDWWWEGDDGSTNPLTGAAILPFSSIYIPDNNAHSSELAGSWCWLTQAQAGANHDQIDLEVFDGLVGNVVPDVALHFNDGALDNNAAVLMPQLRSLPGNNFQVINHDIDFGTVSTQANAVRYSERYASGSFNHNAHAVYGNDTSYYFANGGDPSSYLQDVQVWPQEDDNVSLLFTVLSAGTPPVVQVEGKGYNRDGSVNDFGPLVISLTNGPISIGCIQFDSLQLGGGLSIDDKFVINVAARAGGGYHSDPPIHSDANIAVTGNPWTVGGSTMEYRFAEGAENGKSMDLLGYFVHPLNGGDNSVGVWTGSISLQGIAASGFTNNTVVGGSNAHLEINYNGTTDHRAAALLTGYYFQDSAKNEAVTHFLSELEYRADETQNASVMFEVIGSDQGTLILRGQAHIYDKNGNYRYAYDDYIRLGQNNPNLTLFNDGGADGLNFSQFNFADTSRLQAGDRFTLFISANAEPASSDADEIYLFNSTERRAIYPHNWRFNDGVLDQQDTELRTYQIDYNNGNVHEGIMNFDFADFHGGTTSGLLNALNTPRSIADTAVFSTRYHQRIDLAVAHHYTRLKDINEFWTASGCFLLESPQEISIMSGGQETKIMLNGDDEIVDVLDRINKAIYQSLDQGELLKPENRYKFASFVDSASISSDLEKVDGSLVIRSAATGSLGEISFTGNEELLNALGMSVIRAGSENQVDVELYDAHSGKLLNKFSTQSNFATTEVIDPHIELAFNSRLGLETTYDESREDFTWQEEKHTEVIVQLADNATKLQIGANRGQSTWLDLMDVSASALGVDKLSLITRAHTQQAINDIDQAIEKVSSIRSTLGAFQNRLEHTGNNLSVAGENLLSAESRIRDVDMAKAMSEFIKLNILNQLGTAMLSQANQNPQMVMQLLGK